MRYVTLRCGASAAVVALVCAFAATVPTSTAGAAPKATGSLADVACPTPTSCFVVGGYDDAEHASFQPLVGRLRGGTWKLTPAPAPAAPADKSRGVLSGVTCPAPSRCFAVGNYDVGNGSGKRTLIEQWNGTTWAIASRLRPAGSQSSGLVDIACFAPQRCFAVGWWNFEAKTNAFIAQWNGSTWSNVTTPHIHGDEGEIKQSRLLSISCVRTTSCFAVGSYIDNRRTKALTYRFDGTRWRWWHAPLIPQDITYQSLSAVSCATDNVCHGVGRYGDAAAYGGECCINAPRAMRWNGLRWLDVDSPSSTQSFYDLVGNACPATDRCLAVGTARTWATGKYRALVERWNGSTWAIVSTGLTSVPALSAIVCQSRDSCVAVGGRLTPVVARLHNGSWSAASVPITLGPA